MMVIVLLQNDFFNTDVSVCVFQFVHAAQVPLLQVAQVPLLQVAQVPLLQAAQCRVEPTCSLVPLGTRLSGGTVSCDTRA